MPSSDVQCSLFDSPAPVKVGGEPDELPPVGSILEWENESHGHTCTKTGRVVDHEYEPMRDTHTVVVDTTEMQRAYPIAAGNSGHRYSDPGPEPKGAGKMAGKSERKIASTGAYYAIARERGTAPPRPHRAKRRMDVTARGPNRFYLQPIAGQSGRQQLVDRETGATIDEGSWLNMWGLALRKNGLLQDAEVPRV